MARKRRRLLRRILLLSAIGAGVKKWRDSRIEENRKKHGLP